MDTLTQEVAQRLLDYNQETGEFKWRIKRRGVNVEKILGTDNGFGYLRITVCGKSYYAHRLAWLYVHGHMPKQEIDHINGNKSDNRIANLREATPLQNQQNKTKLQSNNKSGQPGISWHEKSNKWQVHICTCNNRQYLGIYSDIEEAKAVYAAAKKEQHPFSTTYGEKHERIRKTNESQD